ncbi:MAG: hypothetical protein ABI822_12240 [Bryobacteraceae bacterium]
MTQNDAILGGSVLGPLAAKLACLIRGGEDAAARRRGREAARRVALVGVQGRERGGVHPKLLADLFERLAVNRVLVDVGPERDARFEAVEVFPADASRERWQTVSHARRAVETRSGGRCATRCLPG